MLGRDKIRAYILNADKRWKDAEVAGIQSRQIFILYLKHVVFM